MRIPAFIFFLIFSLVYSIPFSYAGLEEFDTSHNSVALGAFQSGGPSKDGIPALTHPKFVSVKDVHFLEEHDQVIGLLVDGQARAYPIRILNWHEIVNDQINNIPVAVTWCPLTHSAITFDRRVGDEELEFGVSGMLYQSNVVMYDRTHQGLYSQLKNSGLTGKYANQTLAMIPTEVYAWGQWRLAFPDGLVLSDQTGYRRNYSQNPYTAHHADPNKTLVLGLYHQGKAKAYPLDQLPETDMVAGEKVYITGQQEGSVRVLDKDGKVLPSVVAYWFAWSLFHPNTQLGR